MSSFKLPFVPEEKKTLAELQEDEEYFEEEDRALGKEVSVEKKRIILKELKKRGDDLPVFTTENGVNWKALAKRFGM